jgi:hypothetical protein
MDDMGPALEPISIDELRRRSQTLERRLEDGFDRISTAELQGRDVTAWEEFWLTLLREYEVICDELRDAA